MGFVRTFLFLWHAQWWDKLSSTFKHIHIHTHTHVYIFTHTLTHTYKQTYVHTRLSDLQQKNNIVHTCRTFSIFPLSFLHSGFLRLLLSSCSSIVQSFQTLPCAVTFPRGQPDHCLHTSNVCPSSNDSHQLTVTVVSEIMDTVHHLRT
jgi:hypothetical protein